MKTLALALLTAGSVIAASASATTIDFSSYPLYTPVSSGPGVAISLYGGPGSGTPVTGSFGTASLGNSPTGNYPTSQGVQFDFGPAVKNVSFTFNNFGDNNYGSPSFFQAFAGAVLTDTGNLSLGDCTFSFCNVSVAGTGITRLRIDNGSNSFNSWEFGIGSVSYDVAGVPEPTTWALMILGFGAVGGAMRRKQAVRATVRMA